MYSAPSGLDYRDGSHSIQSGHLFIIRLDSPQLKFKLHILLPLIGVQPKELDDLNLTMHNSPHKWTDFFLFISFSICSQWPDKEAEQSGYMRENVSYSRVSAGTRQEPGSAQAFHGSSECLTIRQHCGWSGSLFCWVISQMELQRRKLWPVICCDSAFILQSTDWHRVMCGIIIVSVQLCTRSLSLSLSLSPVLLIKSMEHRELQSKLSLLPEYKSLFNFLHLYMP